MKKILFILTITSFVAGFVRNPITSADVIELVIDIDTISSEFQVYEDSSVIIPVSSSVNYIEPSDFLTITVNGVSPGWGFSGADWVYTGVPGEYQYVLAAGVDSYDGSFQLSPPTNSDVDLSDVFLTAALKDGAVELGSSQDSFDVIVDAVADAPTLSLTASEINFATNSIDLDIIAGLTDTDGSEEITRFILKFDDPFLANNLGLTLNNGNYDTLFGRWVLQPDDIAGLQMSIGNPDALTSTFPEFSVRAFSTESNLSDRETDFQSTNDTSTAVYVSVAVPEPTTITLFAVTLLSFSYGRRRR